MPDQPSAARRPGLEELATQGQEYLATRSVSAETARTYERLFDTKWEPFCQRNRFDPLDAPPTAVKRLFEAARSGELRDEGGTGERPTRPVTASYLDTILAAVRYGYLRAGKTPPQHQDGGALALRALREEYQTHLADLVRQPSVEEESTAQLRAAACAQLSLEDFRALCAVEAGTSRRDLAVQVVGLLALDLGATDHELASLCGSHVAVDGIGVCITFPDRVVQVAHLHEPTYGVTPACLACVLVRFIQMPVIPGADADDPVFATTTGQAANASDLRRSVRRMMAVAARSWPGIELSRGAGLGMTLCHADDLDARARVGNRQGLARGSVTGGLAMLRTQTAVKLVVARGLTRADLFGRLRVGDVTHTADGLELRLPQYVGARDRRTIQVRVRRQADPWLCPVMALTEWLMVREAAAGPLDAEEPVFVTVAAGWAAHRRRVPRDVSLNRFKELQRAAGLDPVHTMRSLRQLCVTLAVSQGASEDQVWGTLRLRKPDHAWRFIDAAGGDARAAARAVATDSTDEGERHDA